MLSDDVKKELDKYNQEKKAQYKMTCPRMAMVHEEDHDEADHLDNPEHDLENHLPDDSYPMQDSDIEDLLESHGHYSAKTASTYHILKHSASNRNMSKSKGWTLLGSLLKLWMDENVSQQSNKNC